MSRVEEVEELSHEFNVSRATMSALEINAARKEDLNSLTRLAGEGCPPFLFRDFRIWRGIPEKMSVRCFHCHKSKCSFHMPEYKTWPKGDFNSNVSTLYVAINDADP